MGIVIMQALAGERGGKFLLAGAFPSFNSLAEMNWEIFVAVVDNITHRTVIIALGRCGQQGMEMI
jgi:hypothetical protein